MNTPFYWSVDTDTAGIAHVICEDVLSGATLHFGSVMEVLSDLDGIAHSPPAAFQWRVARPDAPLLCAFTNVAGRRATTLEGYDPTHWHDLATSELPEDSGAKWRRVARERARALDVLGRISECGVVLNPQFWRPLAFNAVIHFQFGPGLAVATNGVDVLLWSAPTVTADWMLVHRTNVIGPVTGTPHDVRDWDYVQNKPKGERTAGANGRPTVADIRARLLAEL